MLNDESPFELEVIGIEVYIKPKIHDQDAFFKVYKNDELIFNLSIDENGQWVAYHANEDKNKVDPINNDFANEVGNCIKDYYSQVQQNNEP